MIGVITSPASLKTSILRYVQLVSFHRNTTVPNNIGLHQGTNNVINYSDFGMKSIHKHLSELQKYVNAFSRSILNYGCKRINDTQQTKTLEDSCSVKYYNSKKYAKKWPGNTLVSSYNQNGTNKRLICSNFIVLRPVQLQVIRCLSSCTSCKNKESWHITSDHSLKRYSTGSDDEQESWEMLVNLDKLSPLERKIHQRHVTAVKKKELMYVDPETGYMVMTRFAHVQRGDCCGNACRHCPFGQVNVPDTVKKKTFNSAFYV